MSTVFDVYAKTYDKELDGLLSHYGTNHHVFSQKRGQILKNLYGKDFRAIEAPLILDFGCGIGGMVPVLRGLFKDCSYTGYEPSPESLEIAKGRFEKEGCQFYSDLNLVGNGFAIIILSGVLHHVLSKEERLNIIRLLLSRLRSDGRLVIFEHNPYNPLTRKMVNDCVYDKDVELIHQQRLIKLVLEAGGQVLDKGYFAFFPFNTRVSLWMERILNRFPLGAQHYLCCANPKTGFLS